MKKEPEIYSDSVDNNYWPPLFPAGGVTGGLGGVTGGAGGVTGGVGGVGGAGVSASTSFS